MSLSPKQVYFANPHNDKHEPEKEEIVLLLNYIKAMAENGFVTVGTLAELEAITNKDDYTPAQVNGDPLAGNNGQYYWLDDEWVRIGDIEASIAVLNQTNTHANDIVAVPERGDVDLGAAIFVFVPIATNTGAMTLDIAGTQVDLRVTKGVDAVAGDIIQGRQHLIHKDDTEYIISTGLNNVDKNTILAAKNETEQAKLEAQTSAATAVAAAADSATASGEYTFATRNATNAAIIRDAPDGVIGSMAGLLYKSDSTAAVSCTSDLSVAGIEPSGTVTPFHWGCVEEPEGTYAGTDQSTKLQAFMNYLNDNSLRDVNWTGAFSVAAKITLGATNQVKTMYCRGRLVLRGMNDITGSLFRVDNLRPDSIWGDLIVNCYGGADYSIRNTPVAIELGAISRAKLGTWQGAYAQIWGVWCTTNPGVKNSNLFKADKLSGIVCGSGYDYAGRSHTGTISSMVDYGAANSTSQGTRISIANVGDNSPAALADYGIESATDPYTSSYSSNDSNPKFIEIAGQIYHVIHENRGGYNFWVYPRVPSTITSGTTFRWIFGGGVGFVGGDSNVAEIGVIEASNCGIGASFGMLYGPKIGMMLTDAVGVAAHFGGNAGNSCFGTCIDSLYIEGGGYHILTTSINVDFKIGNTFALDLNKIKTTVNPTDASGDLTCWYPPIQKGRVGGAGLSFQKLKPANNKVGSSVEFVLDSINKKDHYKVDTITINLSILAGLNHATGVDSGEITIIGSGTNNAPTSITFSPPAGHKINGGAVDAHEVFSTFTTVGNFIVFFDVDNSDWRVILN